MPKELREAAKVGPVVTSTGLRLGSITKVFDGYRFIPATSARKSSRKSHATPEACIPAWVKKWLREGKQ